MNKLIVILLALSLFAVTEFQLSNVLAKPNEEADVKLDPSDTKPKDKYVQDSTGKEDIPSVKLSYGGQTHKMLPFVVVQDQDIHKLNFPQLPDDFKPVLQIPQEEAFSLVFDSKPRETNAFIIDYDADITEISPVNKLGKNSFSISGVHGPMTLEIRTIYPNDKYVTYTLLVDVGKTGSDSAIGSGGDSTESIQSIGNPGKNGQESDIDTYQSLRGINADSVAERIQSEYGGIIEAANPLETDMISPLTEMSQTGRGCMDFEIPIENVTTKNNSTLTDSAKASNSNQESTPWIQIDLGSSKQICGIKVQFKQGTDEVRFFTVELSTDGTSYTEPRYYSNSGSGSSGEIYNYDEEPVSARYIKLTELGKNGTDTEWASELKIMGLRTSNDS
jgi:hypothetical protein